MIVWLPPTYKILTMFFSREKNDKYDGIYGLLDTQVLNLVDEINKTAGKRYNFEYISTDIINFANDIEVPVNKILVRLGVAIENDVFNIKQNKLIVAYPTK